MTTRRPWLTAPLAAYPFALCGLALALFLRWPVVAGDTDVWYHLNGGRYILQHGRLPTDSFFSFLTPPRPWVDYYWLFQVLVYTLHAISGYPGLILLRTCASIATLLVALLLLRHAGGGRRSIGWIALLFGALLPVLMPRMLLVRPHLFTYGFIAVFLWILEARSKLRWMLPPLAIVWCNVHGIMYPVMLLILGAYVLERFLSRGSRSSDRAKDVVPLVLAMLAIYCTPHGMRLSELPFRSLGYARHFIGEFRPAVHSMDLGQLLSIHVEGLIPSYETLLNVWIWLAVGSLLIGMSSRTARPSHVVLWLGGALLLTRGIRFSNECVLLTLPLMARHPLHRPAALHGIPKGVALVCGALLMAMPVQLLAKRLQPTPAYPVSRQSVPEGVAAFLQHVGTGGTLFNDPSSGGYLQWRLYPHYKIFMDLETPFLFSNEDLYVAQYAHLDRFTLRKTLEQYRPSFISVPIRLSHFPDLMSPFPEYRLVFFDDAEVLYVNQEAHPEVAQRYALERLNPFTIVGKPPEEAIPDEDVAGLASELQRMVSIDPGAGITNQLLGFVANRQGRYASAVTHAAAIISSFPDSPSGYRLMGSALEGLGNIQAAITAYRRALTRMPRGQKTALYRDLGRTYRAAGHYERAYHLLKQSIDVFAVETPIEDLELLGATAQAAGRTREADAIFRYAREFRGGTAEAATP